jgi:hypothetical protein
MPGQQDVLEMYRNYMEEKNVQESARWEANRIKVLEKYMVS